MINNNNELSIRIKSRRKELKLTAEEIANLTGLSRSTISRYETGGIKQIKLAVIESLADALRVNPDWLIGKSEFKEKRTVPLSGSDRYDMEKILNVLIEWMSETDSEAKYGGAPMDINQRILVMTGLQSVKRMVENSK